MKNPRIPLDELRARYDALPPLRPAPGERRWYDRLATWEDFLEFGPLTAEYFSDIDDVSDNWLRPAAPELFDLVMEAFG